MTSPATHRVALALMAHPDDAEILCGGTLVRLADLGWKIHIANATPGDCGTTTRQRGTSAPSAWPRPRKPRD